LPTRLRRPCTFPGCPNLEAPETAGGKNGGRCQEHRRQPIQYDSSHYRTPEWRALRAAQLERYPWCAHCADIHVRVPATQVDHIRSRKRGGTDDPSNLQSLCARHHAIKTLSGG